MMWQTSPIPSDVPHVWSLGPLTIHVRRVGDEILLATERAEDPDASDTGRPLARLEGDLPEDLDWSRFVSHHEPCEIRFLPIMPDRPVVARPADSVTLPAGESAVFYVSIPVWIRLETKRLTYTTVKELPTIVLSNTWFGDPMAGDLCYALRTRARRDTADIHERPHRAVCPVHVANRSSDPLLIERLCVHVAFLAVYGDPQGRLWTQRVSIQFRGRDRVSDLNYGASAPEAARDATLLSSPREKHDNRNLLRRSLSSVREVFQL